MKQEPLNPIEEALLAPPSETVIPDYFDPEATPELLTIENSKELIEDRILRTFLDIMESGIKDSDRRAAASDAAELIGKKGAKAQQGVQLISAENVQINQIDQNPELKRHLIEAAKGLGALTHASNSGVKVKGGGSGI